MEKPEVIVPDHEPQRIPIWALVILGLIVAAIVFLTLQFVFQIGIFHSGTINFNEAVTAANRDFITDALSDTKFSSDITISSNQTFQSPDIPNTLTLDVLVPVSDFYSSILNISTDQLTQLTAGQTVDNIELLSIWNLKPEFRLLSVDNDYYLDTLNSGAVFNNVTISGHSSDVTKAIALLSDSLQPAPTREEILTLAQTGVTALSRRMNTALMNGNPETIATDFAKYIGPI